ncbi:hypothetical protein P7K49_022713 [Saguinus oedipus]|uniref:Unkempt zinc finger domain-containing protein n=1 Tax=Saguinus oedipus TaxID=9490 RepID=A0ABQ9UJI9_SAGOE|nr:hypothetical protein P7K49_022713 [Saguinus oedipus]
MPSVSKAAAAAAALSGSPPQTEKPTHYRSAPVRPAPPVRPRPARRLPPGPALPLPPLRRPRAPPASAPRPGWGAATLSAPARGAQGVGRRLGSGVLAPLGREEPPGVGGSGGLRLRPGTGILLSGGRRLRSPWPPGSRGRLGSESGWGAAPGARQESEWWSSRWVPRPAGPRGRPTEASAALSVFRYLKEFRTEQCPLFSQHKCAQHRPFTCFHWHFLNQRRRRPLRRRDGTFNYSPDVYCSKYNEATGVCPDGDE